MTNKAKQLNQYSLHFTKLKKINITFKSRLGIIEILFNYLC